jgi:hypothetical protein
MQVILPQYRKDLPDWFLMRMDKVKQEKKDAECLNYMFHHQLGLVYELMIKFQTERKQDDEKWKVIGLIPVSADRKSNLDAMVGPALKSMLLNTYSDKAVFEMIANISYHHRRWSFYDDGEFMQGYNGEKDLITLSDFLYITGFSRLKISDQQLKRVIACIEELEKNLRIAGIKPNKMPNLNEVVRDNYYSRNVKLPFLQ